MTRFRVFKTKKLLVFLIPPKNQESKFSDFSSTILKVFLSHPPPDDVL